MRPFSQIAYKIPILLKIMFYCESDVHVMDLKTINMSQICTARFQLVFFVWL